jgi:hypothetical protein
LDLVRNNRRLYKSAVVIFIYGYETEGDYKDGTPQRCLHLVVVVGLV